MLICFYYFSEKIKLDIACNSNEMLSPIFSEKKKIKKKIKTSSAAAIVIS